MGEYLPQPDAFGNMGQDPSAPANPNPMPGANSGSNVIDELVRHLSNTVQTQQRVVMPQQLPPRQVQAGDASGNFVNPSTVGGPKHNARVSLAQTIGNVAAQAINRHEEKESRDLAYSITRVESLYNTLNDPNATDQQKQMATQELNEIDKGTWKKIQKATGIQIFGQEDKRTNVEKKAMAQAKQASQQGQQQQTQPNAQQQGQPQQQGGQPQLNPMAAQFLKRLGTTTGLTPAAAATAELTKSGVIPNAGELLKYASDQQYYKVLEDKLGVEAATKIQAIAAKSEADYNKYQADLYKATTKAEQEEAKTKMMESFHNASMQMQEARIGMMQERLDLDKDKEKAKEGKQELDKLNKTSKSLNDQVNTLNKAKVAAQKIASTGFFASEKQRQAAKDLQTIDSQIKDIQQRQQQVNQKLESINQSTADTTSVTSPELDDTYKKLMDKYLKDNTPTTQTGQRQSL